VHPEFDSRHPNRRRAKSIWGKAFEVKAATIVGIILIVLGIVGFAMGGFSYTHEKKDIDMGPLQVTHKETRTVPISPILSTVSLVAGVVLMVAGARKSS
jgi:uncharacterized membrane protein YidH (DUF202 family)